MASASKTQANMENCWRYMPLRSVSTKATMPTTRREKEKKRWYGVSKLRTLRRTRP